MKTAKNHLLVHLEKYNQDSGFYNSFPPVGDKPVQKDDNHATTHDNMEDKPLTKGVNMPGGSETDSIPDGHKEL